MSKRILLAGASGVVGRRLVPLLISAGHHVTGTTRSGGRAGLLERQGAVPVIVDMLNPKAVHAVVETARPDVLIHQLTDLSGGDPFKNPEILERNARIRREATTSLVQAALAVGVRRVVAQSIAFAYAPGSGRFTETSPLDVMARGPRAASVAGVMALEHAVLTQLSISGVVLRYGLLYGPGAGSAMPVGPSPVHVDAAAFAALLAIDCGHGIYNITDEGSDATSERAHRELGWDPGFRAARCD